MIDFLTRVLFESLPLLLVAIAVALAVALAVHRRRFTTGSRRGLLATAGVGVLLIVVQALVVTDREAIQQTLREAASAVQAGDVPALGEQIDEAFSAQGMDKQQLLARSNQMLQRWQVNSARLSGFRIEVDGDEATVSFRVLCDLRSDSWVQDNTLSLWRLRCVRRPEGWKVQRVLEARFGPAGIMQGGGMDIMRQIR
jgi:hypothetical protein